MQGGLLPDLPSEVLVQILEYAIPVHRLSGQRPIDPEWSDYVGRGPEHRQSLPSLLFVCKKLSEQAIAIFYDKAILEIQPIKPPQYILNGIHRGLSLDLAVGLSLAHAFCPAANLRRIKRVHVFSGQSDAINAEGYEATLRWLIQNTAVKHIHLSRLVMTRLRKARVDVRSALDAIGGQYSLSSVRNVYVWTEHPRSYWERTRMREMAKAQGVEPPPLQMYLYSPERDMDPVLDARWDARSSDGHEWRSKSEAVSSFLDSIAARDPICPQAKSSWELPHTANPPTNRLYQVCFILGDPNASSE